MQVREAGIYRIVNTITGDFYIGSAINLTKRKSHHKCYLDKGTHSNEHLQRAWDKYGGIMAFKFEVILYCNKEDLIKQEQYYIDTLKPAYNICKTAYSTIGKPTSKEANTKRRLFMMSFTHSEESKAKMRVKWEYIGRKMSEEQKKQISIQRSKAVLKFDLNGNLLGEYSSTKEAAIFNLGASTVKSLAGTISSVCTGMRNTAGGYKWAYKN